MLGFAVLWVHVASLWFNIALVWVCLFLYGLLVVDDRNLSVVENSLFLLVTSMQAKG